MKKIVIGALIILTVSGVVGAVYLADLLSKTINDAKKYHPPIGAPVVPRANVTAHENAGQ